jgi:hypothetical protein
MAITPPDLQAIHVIGGAAVIFYPSAIARINIVWV